ncbi:hypothetical protein [Actinoplanes sp. NBRC 103695]|uniref:hypothetical protein n=1 Tax=Actinoplanes sp. NBRC 103695 TaxID=3032202 RepID=UPI00255478AF|nr:hypothetical protein [Actinoplanes sp. NBRC 103695]
MEAVLYLDPPPHSWRTRRINVSPEANFAVVELDREHYAETHERGATSLPPEYAAAIERLRMVCFDRIWLEGYSGSLAWGSGNYRVTLYVPYPHEGETAEALRAAEVEDDYSKLEDLASRLTLPVDDWLAPGERLLRRGVDFQTRPGTFLRFLRAKAASLDLRLNGRAVPEGVWIRPQLSKVGKLNRSAFPENYTDQPDRWSDAPPQTGLLRPLETRVRRGDHSKHALPTDLRRLGARPRVDCPCGFRGAFGGYGVAEHEAHHQLWSIGLRVPKTVPWEFGNLAVVTTQSSVAWRRLAAQLARAPKRENHYDFASWEVGDRPEPSSTNRRALLLRHGEYAVGYLVAADLARHRRWDLESDVYAGEDTTVRPSIDLIWVAAVHRGRGVGGALVSALAQDFGCAVADVSWSDPVSNAGQRLARRISPGGIWVH